MIMKTILFRTTMLMLSLLVLTTNVEAKKKKYPNGDVYVGKWKKGAPEGQGKLTRANGEWCEGIWHVGYLTEGDYHMTDGTVYKGTWTISMTYFKGTMTSASSDVYTGEGYWEKWSEGTGEGTITYATGAVYKGSWKKFNKNGRGTYTDVSANHYKGEWKNDSLAKGTCHRADGTLEDGEWIAMTLQNGTRKYWKEYVQYIETVCGGRVTETKQILPSGTEYWPDI